MRIDKWLWSARFYKTRKLATQAVTGGHIHVNGDRVKPAKGVSVNDELEIRKGTLSFVIKVCALTNRRGPASEAQKLYQEHPESIAARETAREQRKIMAGRNPKPTRRPDKRERRKIIRFINKNQ